MGTNRSGNICIQLEWIPWNLSPFHECTSLQFDEGKYIIEYNWFAFSNTLIITGKINNDHVLTDVDQVLLKKSSVLSLVMFQGIVHSGIYPRGVISVGKFHQTPTTILGSRSRWSCRMVYLAWMDWTTNCSNCLLYTLNYFNDRISITK